MKIKAFTFLICLSYFFISCSKNKVDEPYIDKVISIGFNSTNLKNYSHTGSILDTVELIKLVENPNKDFQISQIDKILIKGNYIYTADTYLKKLLVFDKQGNALASIGDVGQGPGEFNALSDFYVTDENEVIVYDGALNKILIYNLDGDFQRDYKVRFKAESMVPLEDGFIFSLAPYNIDNLKNKKIILTDKSFNIKESSLNFISTIDNNYEFISPMIKSGHNIIYNRPISDIVYIYNKTGKLEKAFKIDFSNLNINIEDLKDIHSLLESGKEFCYLAHTPIYINNYLFLILNANQEMYTCIYDLSQDEVYLNKMENYSLENINLPFSITDEGDIVSYFNQYIYSDYQKDERIPEDFKKHLEDDNFVICLYKLK